MMDLISRQKAIDALMDALDDVGVLDAEDINTVFRMLPPIQPEIIRCKDCRFSDSDATCCLVCCRDGQGLKFAHVRADDFCSYAERREVTECQKISWLYLN